MAVCVYGMVLDVWMALAVAPQREAAAQVIPAKVNARPPLAALGMLRVVHAVLAPPPPLALALEASTAQSLGAKSHATPRRTALGIRQQSFATRAPAAPAVLALALEAAQVIRTKVHARTITAIGILHMVHAMTITIAQSSLPPLAIEVVPNAPLALAIEAAPSPPPAAQIFLTQANAVKVAAIGILEMVYAISTPNPPPAAQILITHANAMTMAAIGIMQVVYAVSTLPFVSFQPLLLSPPPSPSLALQNPFALTPAVGIALVLILLANGVAVPILLITKSKTKKALPSMKLKK